MKFYKSNFDYYREVESRSDVAVLHSFASMAYNNDLPWQSTMLFEQALIQAKIPFDIVFDDHLKDLSKYRVLVLADQECLSETQLEQIRSFVNGGGGLVATEHSSLYTEWRQRWKEFGLRDLLKVSAPEWRGSRAAEGLASEAPARSQAGKGRVVYIPSVKAIMDKPPAAPMTSQYWKLPSNWQELAGAVKWAAGDSLALEVKAPLTVTAELIEQKAQGRLLVHLLNYDVERTPATGAIEVSLAIPEGKAPGEVSLLSPDEGKPSPLKFVLRNGRAVIAVPRLKTYSVVTVALK